MIKKKITISLIAFLLSLQCFAKLSADAPCYVTETPLGALGIYVVDSNYCYIVLFDSEIHSPFNFKVTVSIIAVVFISIISMATIMIVNHIPPHRESTPK